MQSFRDCKDRTWDVCISVNTIKRVRGRLQVNLLDVFEGKLVDRLATDPVLLVDCLYVICEEQAASRGISDEEFGRAMAGDAIELASKALLEELISFSPSPKHRETLTRVVRAAWRGIDKARDLAAARVTDEALNNLVDKVIQDALAETGLPSANASSGSAPVSSESTPAR